ncbi:hypothetical protein chiPu_0018288 [Chiloscyllium punctatum]|uniref:Uncharacterized protein n=1 Tax=Chiloscyllium punctatum TaxID=137246 RepID=A0A401RM82_CHIPU|nr:hypothetical protein [Chiloscyllium punctatum]
MLTGKRSLSSFGGSACAETRCLLGSVSFFLWRQRVRGDAMLTGKRSLSSFGGSACAETRCSLGSDGAELSRAAGHQHE